MSQTQSCKGRCGGGALGQSHTVITLPEEERAMACQEGGDYVGELTFKVEL